MSARSFAPLIALLLPLVFPGAPAARTWHLSPGGGGDATSIAAAMLLAAPGDTVLLACGTYYEHGIVLKSGTCLRSESGDWTCATIDAGHQGRVLAGQNLRSSTRVEGLTISGGFLSQAYGAGLSCGQSSLTISHCRFTGNTGAYEGGGVYVAGDTLTVEDCLFDANAVGGGSDPFNGDGGAISANVNWLLLRRVEFRDNQAGDSGGAIFAAGSTEATDCVFFRNFSSFGGSAITAGYYGRDVLVTGCTFHANTASPALSLSESRNVLANSIIAFGDADAVECYGGTLDVRCCDVVGNGGGDWTGCLEGHLGVDGNIWADPLFCDPVGGDVHLLDISPCAAAQQAGCGQIGAEGVQCVACPSRTWHLAADGSGDAPTIQAAFDAACFRDTIELADGIYRGIGNRDVTSHGKPVVLRSRSGNPDSCVIDCQGSAADPHRGFLVDPGPFGSPRFEGITIENGWVSGTYGAGDGGGIYFTTGEPGAGDFPVMVNCRIVNCRAGEFGGAVYSRDRMPIFGGCRFMGNSAGQDGGGLAFGYGRPMVDSCVFAGNSASHGGGVIFAQCSPASFTRNLISGNTASRGGGIYSELARGVWSGNTVSGNSAPTGAGVYLYYYSNPRLENCLIADNRQGPGIACAISSGATLDCCDVFGNEGGDWVDCISAQVDANGNFAADPLFCNPESLDFRLHSDSPCLPGQHPHGDDCGLVGALPQGCGSLGTAVASGPESGMAGENLRFSLGPSVPNPFNPSATILYTLPPAGGRRAGATASRVTLRVYDATGRLVRTLVDQNEAVGRYSSHWDGSDASGHTVASGMYFAMLRFGDQRAALRMVLLK